MNKSKYSFLRFCYLVAYEHLAVSSGQALHTNTERDVKS